MKKQYQKAYHTIKTHFEFFLKNSSDLTYTEKFKTLPFNNSKFPVYKKINLINTNKESFIPNRRSYNDKHIPSIKSSITTSHKKS